VKPSRSNGFDAKTIVATKNTTTIAIVPATYGISSGYFFRLTSSAAEPKVETTSAHSSSEPFWPA
jgi:hypothetical protein